MSAERRRAERVRVNLDVMFTDQLQQQKGTISDISVTGCFILSAGDATAAAPVTVTIQLPSKKAIKLTGEVVYNTPEIGFAIRFRELPKSGQSFLEKLVKRLSQAQNQPNASPNQN
jgi:hypothetical protein